MAKSVNPKVMGDGRFTFSSSGEFNAPYKFENLVKLIVIAAGISLVAVVSLVSVKVMSATIESFERPGGEAFSAIVAAAVIIAVAVITFLACGMIVKYIGTGFKCTYSSNDEKMMLNYGKTEFIIFYADVDLVNFSPRSFMNKINGYDVQIRVNGEMMEFSIVSDAYISPKSTPFFIIKTQMERLHAVEIDPSEENRTEREIAMNIGSGRAISQAEIERAHNRKSSVYDRLDALLGEGAPSEGKTVEKPAEEKYEYVSPYAGKVSPTTKGFAGDMPQSTEEFENPEHEIVYRDGREEDLFSITKMGTFYVVPNKGEFFCGALLWFFLGAVAGGVIGYILEHYSHIAYLMNFIMLVFGIIFTINGIMHLHGHEYKYRADGRSMKISSRKAPEENIVFEYVTGITYTPKKLFGKPYALKVSIVTRYSTINYNYLYPRYGTELRESELPFEVIKENIREN